MPHRSDPLILGILGLFALVVLVLLWRDPRRAATSGARWKRRLVSAGLSLLAVFGVHAPATAEVRSGSGGPGCGECKIVTETAEWKRLVRVWDEAEAVASGERGAYPFDRAGKERLLAELDAVSESLGSLPAGGLLTESEAGLLREDIAALRARVVSKRPREMERATCYKRAYVDPVKKSVERMEARLPLLERMLASGQLKPQVVEKLLVQLERDLEILAKPGASRRTTPADAEKARELAARARGHVARLHAALHADGLGSTEEWGRVTAVWKEAQEVSSGKRGSHPFDEAGKVALLARMDGTKRDIEALRGAGHIGPAAAELLQEDLAILRGGVQSKRPTEMRMATCYQAIAVDERRTSYERLKARLPLLQRLVTEERVSPAVADKVLAQVQRDLARLRSADPPSTFGEAEQQHAEKLAAAIEERVERLKAVRGTAR